jgi:hypothetical protein
LKPPISCMVTVYHANDSFIIYIYRFMALGVPWFINNTTVFSGARTLDPAGA